MHDLKKMWNKARVEGSTCEAYITQKVSAFCSFYFELSIQTKLTQILRNDDGRDVESMGHLSIFCHPDRPFDSDNFRRMMSNDEYKAVHIYILLNIHEIMSFIK